MNDDRPWLVLDQGQAPMTTKLNLIRSSSSATTYEFCATERLGWAICTVNDSTGELLITSDWGNWSYMWSPNPHQGLGCATLTHFLGVNRVNGAPRSDVDYFVMKLLGKHGAQRFSPEKTTAHFRGILCQTRRDFSRRFARGLDHGRVSRAGHFLTADVAREIWDDLGALASDVSGQDQAAATLYCERFMMFDDFGFICDAPWEDLQHETSPEYTILSETILPALAAACYAKAQEPNYQALRDVFESERAAREAKREAERIARVLDEETRRRRIDSPR